MVEGIKKGVIWGLPLMGVNINNFWWGGLLPYTTTKYQITANSIENRAQEPQNTENWRVPYMEATRKNGPIFIIFCGEI